MAVKDRQRGNCAAIGSQAHAGGETLWALDGKANNNIVRSDGLGAIWTSVAVSADLFVTLDVCGTTVFATYSAGATYATTDGFYLAMSSGTNCDIFFSASGAPSSYISQTPPCSADTTLTHLTQANTTAVRLP